MDKPYAYGSLFRTDDGRYMFGPSQLELKVELLESVNGAGAAIARQGPDSLVQLNQRMYDWARAELSTDFAIRLANESLQRIASTNRRLASSIDVDGLLSRAEPPLPDTPYLECEQVLPERSKNNVRQRCKSTFARLEDRIELLEIMQTSPTENDLRKVESLFDKKASITLRAAAQAVQDARARLAHEKQETLGSSLRKRQLSEAYRAARIRYEADLEELADATEKELREELAMLDRQTSPNGAFRRSLALYRLWDSYVNER